MSEFDTRIERHTRKTILPPDFFDIVFHRYFPVAALTYIASLLGVALRNTSSFDTLVRFLFHDPYAYNMALFILLWTSFPAIFWIIIRSSVRYAARADVWYKGIVVLMVLTMFMSYFLFPEWDFGNQLRIFFVATIPVFFVQYFFFIRGGFPAAASWPLTVMGLVLMIYGVVIL